MNEFIITGMILGLSAGLAPGPLLALVISETFQNGLRSGLTAAVSPLVTDLPIIFLSLFFLVRISGAFSVLAIISFAGAFVVLMMGISSLRSAPEMNVPTGSHQKALVKGILINALSPHPYLFWLTVGGPVMLRAVDQGVSSLFGFAGAFYMMLIGSKILTAFLTHRTGPFLRGRFYRGVMRTPGVMLCCLAFLLFYEGAKLLGLIA